MLQNLIFLLNSFKCISVEAMHTLGLAFPPIIPGPVRTWLTYIQSSLLWCPGRFWDISLWTLPITFP